MVPVLLQSHGNEDQNCVKVDKAGTITYYDCHDKYMNLNNLNTFLRNTWGKTTRWWFFELKFQPAHSPELGGRREDKLAASALREQNAGRNLPKKSVVESGQQLRDIVGWPHLEAESPGSSSCGEERLSSLASGWDSAKLSGTKPHDALRKTSRMCFILFVSLTNHRFYALKTTISSQLPQTLSHCEHWCPWADDLIAAHMKRNVMEIVCGAL